MFRLRLHPTPSGFVTGIAVIALWALLWLWFVIQLVEAPRSADNRPGVRALAANVEIAADRVP
jgi:hypothetical protein